MEVEEKIETGTLGEVWKTLKRVWNWWWYYFINQFISYFNFNESIGILFLNSVGSPSKRRPSSCLSPSHEEERRRILKLLVTPQANKRTQSSASFDSMVMKAARSAENVSKDEKEEANSSNNKHNKLVRNVKTETKSRANIIRKQSSQSLQIPERVPLRRSISDTETRIAFWLCSLLI